MKGGDGRGEDVITLFDLIRIKGKRMIFNDILFDLRKDMRGYNS